MGECYTAMQGSLPARQVSMRIGLPIESSAVTVNQNCASGMRALEIACNNHQLGKTDIGLVVGVENRPRPPSSCPRPVWVTAWAASPPRAVLSCTTA